MTKGHDDEGAPPEALYVGMTKGQWPIQTFVSERHAMDWLAQDDDIRPRRRLWHVRLTGAVELRYVAPEPYLQPVGSEEVFRGDN